MQSVWQMAKTTRKGTKGVWGGSGADNILKTWQSVGKCQQPGTHILCICGKWQLASGKCAWKINNHVILSSTYDEKALKQLDAKRQKLISYILKFQFILPRTSARRLQADNTHHSHAPPPTPPTADPRPAASLMCVCVSWLGFCFCCCFLPACLAAFLAWSCALPSSCSSFFHTCHLHFWHCC